MWPKCDRLGLYEGCTSHFYVQPLTQNGRYCGRNVAGLGSNVARFRQQETGNKGLVQPKKSKRAILRQSCTTYMFFKT